MSFPLFLEAWEKSKIDMLKKDKVNNRNAERLFPTLAPKAEGEEECLKALLGIERAPGK